MSILLHTFVCMREEIQKEAIEIALKYDSATIVMPVRTGKTKVGLDISKQYDRVLVSYPSKSIKQSWLDDAEKFEINIDNITFTTHLSIHKHILSEYDCIILDELHEVSVAQWAEIINQDYKKLIGLTATPSVIGPKRKYMNSFCPIRYEIKLEDTVGVINKDYEIFIHLISPSSENNIHLKNGRSWNERAKIAWLDKKYQSSKRFNDMLMLIGALKNSHTKLEYFKKLIEKIDRGLFFLETKEQCKTIGLASYYSGEENSEENLRKFQNQEIDKLLTINQLKAGVTFPFLKELVILHSYSSNNKASQKIGRALNYVEGEKAIIHIIVLKNTKDEIWAQNALKEFDQTKIKYI